LMPSWDGSLEIIKKEKLSWVRKKMDELENVVAAFYMKSFFEQFQWTPVLP
ncbi:hypothetical protein L208DRAFT_1126378, partial [Tricholoma matsutake]